MLGPEFKSPRWAFGPVEPAGDKVVLKRTDPTDLDALFATKTIGQDRPARLELVKSFIRATKRTSQILALLLIAPLVFPV